MACYTVMAIITSSYFSMGTMLPCGILRPHNVTVGTGLLVELGFGAVDLGLPKAFGVVEARTTAAVAITCGSRCRVSGLGHSLCRALHPGAKRLRRRHELPGHLRRDRSWHPPGTMSASVPRRSAFSIQVSVSHGRLRIVGSGGFAETFGTRPRDVMPSLSVGADVSVCLPELSIGGGWITACSFIISPVPSWLRRRTSNVRVIWFARSASQRNWSPGRTSSSCRVSFVAAAAAGGTRTWSRPGTV